MKAKNDALDESRADLRRLKVKEAGDASVNELKAQPRVANDDIEKHAQEADSNAYGFRLLAKAKHSSLKLSNPTPAKAQTPMSVHWPDLPPNGRIPKELHTIKYISPRLETSGKRGWKRPFAGEED